MRSLVDGDEASVSATALHCTARRGGAAGAGGGGGGGGTSAALLCVAPRGTAAGVRSVRDFASLEYVDAEAARSAPTRCPPFPSHLRRLCVLSLPPERKLTPARPPVSRRRVERAVAAVQLRASHALLQCGV
jgi:hypothetical protein